MTVVMLIVCGFIGVNGHPAIQTIEFGANFGGISMKACQRERERIKDPVNMQGCQVICLDRSWK